MISSTAMILAAGRGRRLSPLTDTTPKPLLEVAGLRSLDFAIKQVKEAGFERIVINTHHLGQQIHSHLKGDKDIIFSDEQQLLETAGGIRKAIDFFEGRPFVVVNGDILWHGASPVQGLLNKWNPNTMDALLSIVSHKNALHFTGTGDFDINSSGLLTMETKENYAPYIFMGVSILKPEILQDLPLDQPVALGGIFKNISQNGLLHGVPYDGKWCDIGHKHAFDQMNRVGFD